MAQIRDTQPLQQGENCRARQARGELVLIDHPFDTVPQDADVEIKHKTHFASGELEVGQYINLYDYGALDEQVDLVCDLDPNQPLYV